MVSRWQYRRGSGRLGAVHCTEFLESVKRRTNGLARGRRIVNQRQREAQNGLLSGTMTTKSSGHPKNAQKARKPHGTASGKCGMLCFAHNDDRSSQLGLPGRMKELAHKGGAVTKRRHGSDPRYYCNIGRRGGRASVEARKARIAAEP